MTSEERLRRRYRPRRIRVLLVGESPPASGRHFYAANSGLYRAIRDTFVDSRLLLDDEDLREYCRDNGWLLYDLSQRPLNRLDSASRRRAHEAGVPSLARVIRTSQPEAILAVVAAIGPRVRQAIRLAGWSGSYRELPYPGRWVQARRRFRRRLARFLVEITPEERVAPPTRNSLCVRRIESAKLFLPEEMLL